MGSRLATALVGLVVSLGISIGLYWLTDSLLVFIFLPFVPFLFSRGTADGAAQEPTTYECPACHFRTQDQEFDYCPRDGTRLRQAEEQDR